MNQIRELYFVDSKGPVIGKLMRVPELHTNVKEPGSWAMLLVILELALEYIIVSILDYARSTPSIEGPIPIVNIST